MITRDENVVCIAFHVLITLRFAETVLGSEGTAKIAQLLHTNTSIRTLDLTCELACRGARMRTLCIYTGSMQNLNCLQHDYLVVETANAVEDMGATALGHALANNTTLVKLVSSKTRTSSPDTLQGYHQSRKQQAC